MANYLATHYKGKYRIKGPYDLSTNDFIRKENGTLEDIDCYIDCMNNVQIFYYGKSILEAYIPSIIRGHNIINAIKKDIGENIILHTEETSSEVLFRFHARNMENLEKYLKPRTLGANISPYSSKNLPKSDYKIPDEDLGTYKNMVANLPHEKALSIAHMTNDFINGLATKKNPIDKIKADMRLKCMNSKQYIHSIGQWNNFIKYLEKNLCQI